VTAAQLAILPGPLPRPLASGSVVPPPPPPVYRLPVEGRLVTGFGEMSDSGVRARGLTFVVRPGAGVRAPAGGTVRYARVFRDYGRILILDHGDGWTSLLTGMADLLVEPGATVTAGQPVGRAGRTGGAAGDPARVTVELRRRGRPVDMTALTG
jgi:septal ring factor EnvC (AmiA/AmiB activator)